MIPRRDSAQSRRQRGAFDLSEQLFAHYREI
jgi:hypothetical protein